MSVKQRMDRDGQYEVRWREGGRQRKRLFARKGDATAFDLDIKRRKQLGALAGSVLQSRMTLTDFVREEWWPRYAVPNLKPRTRDTYAHVFAKHLAPRVGGYELRQITPTLVEEFSMQLHAAGVGAPMRIKTLGLLQRILRSAVVRGLIPANPVLAVDKPKQRATRRIEPLPPTSIEAIRAHLPSPRDRLLLSIMGYQGLRPDEATRVRVEDIGDRTLYVYARKTETKRHVTLLAPVDREIREYLLATGIRSGLLFPRRHGGEWSDSDWRNWRRRVYQGTEDKPGAARKAGVTGDMRPYRLRVSFVSLLLWEGRNVAYVAAQAGHDVATLAAHYAGVIEELEGKPRISAEAAIDQARAEQHGLLEQRRAKGTDGA